MNVFKLKAKFVERNLNVEEVATAIGISPSTLYRKLKYPSRLTLSEVLQIKDILKITNEEAVEIFLA